MIDFEAYDKAILGQLQHAQVPARAPLLSWDLHLEHAVNRSKFSSHDFNRLQKLSTESHWVLPAKVQKMLQNPDVVIVTNPQLEIVFASENMFGMNGFYPDEVIGKKPDIFQGIGTEAEARKKVATAIAKKKPFSVKLTNYYKDGESYLCEVKGFPVFDQNGELVHFIAFERAA